jgi:hypothetical protein
VKIAGHLCSHCARLERWCQLNGGIPKPGEGGSSHRGLAPCRHFARRIQRSRGGPDQAGAATRAAVRSEPASLPAPRRQLPRRDRLCIIDYAARRTAGGRVAMRPNRRLRPALRITLRFRTLGPNSR